ncbi:hypothetical protein [Gluconacetobacter diazotrophicus]|uniref:hypothetical protein n=1 Tax=Gluconacetobacter diazotrophicus TaxID=33996 RepID=UPI0012FEFC91|nr:hypothetical protein [Gluconacetobacter diazotrophicus]
MASKYSKTYKFDPIVHGNSTFKSITIEPPSINILSDAMERIYDFSDGASEKEQNKARLEGIKYIFEKCATSPDGTVDPYLVGQIRADIVMEGGNYLLGFSASAQEAQEK